MTTHMKSSMTAREKLDMDNYVNHSMNIGNFEKFVKEHRVSHGTVYRGLRLHESNIQIGSVLKHFEPLLSCSEELEVSETFAVNGFVPEDVVTDKLSELGRDEETEYGMTYEEFTPVVLVIKSATGIRLLDYLEDNYEYASEKEIVLLNEPLVIEEIEMAFTSFGEPYELLHVRPIGL